MLACCDAARLIGVPLAPGGRFGGLAVALAAVDRRESRCRGARRQGVRTHHRRSPVDERLRFRRKFLKLFDRELAEQLAFLIQLLAHRNVGGELDPLRGLPDGVRPYKSLDVWVNPTSAEVLTQPTLVVDV